jgi:hypothetical protein
VKWEVGESGRQKARRTVKWEVGEGLGPPDCQNPREPGGFRRPLVAAPSVILSLSKNPCILGLNTNTVILRSAQDDGARKDESGPFRRG